MPHAQRPELVAPGRRLSVRLAGPTVYIVQSFDRTTWGPGSGERSVVVEGSDDAVLLHADGRLPFEQAGLTVTGDRDLAVRLKELVPGP